ncbi:histidine kinase [Cribrihabitans marinus]|uniref:histidine kinase n=1 Tax=Cribrihabitans marinus TaxID=1227549 RepID=A0A1H6QDP5_9RHOB|nr:ATP-binding protein [Cribrihabitans marinus]GGH18004.1 two-component sensor histidine kinase [Cribrihabitans marinus]SEI39034.1 histidine kinase [Cribrihabitans marinus]
MADALIDAILAATPLPAILVGSDERIAGANAEAQALLGAALTGRHFAAILRQPPLVEAIERCIAERSPQTARHLSRDGAHDTTYEVHCRPLPGLGAGQGDAVFVSFVDLTQMEQAGQMRRDFVANVSHELRTPLTALMGFIETLRGAARDDAKARDRFLGIMEAEANRMNRLVGDLLSLNRVESEERVRPAKRLDLGTLLSSALATLRPLADEAGVELNLTVGQDPVEVPGEPDQLRQVVVNLVENAIKYGGAGGSVDVALTVLDHDAAMRGPAARIEVTDHGPGIDPVHLPRLTERFYRVDSHRSREMGGTGLGLAIVKHILNRHRGRLRVDSAPSKGATFTVILPR